MKKLLLILLPRVSMSSPADELFGSLHNLRGYTPAPERTRAIQNMPPTTNQQGLGICYAHSTATVINYHNCQIMNLDCTILPAKDLASPLDIARYGKLPDGDPTYESSCPGIKSEGGPNLLTLEIAALHAGSTTTQACLSEDLAFGKRRLRRQAPGQAAETPEQADRHLPKIPEQSMRRLRERQNGDQHPQQAEPGSSSP